jgi:hypothetical protein
MTGDKINKRVRIVKNNFFCVGKIGDICLIAF